MDAKRRKRRQLIRCFWGLTMGGLLLFVLTPVWFPWVLAPAAKRFGLQYSAYDRIGLTRFAVTAVRGEWRGTQLSIRRAESVLPTTWFWRKLQPGTSGPPSLSLSDAHLIVGGSASNAARQGSMAQALEVVSEVGSALQRWLPVADLHHGVIEVASNRVSITDARWRAGRLEATLQRLPGLGEIEVTGRLGETPGLRITARAEAHRALLDGEFVRRSDGWSWKGELGWLTNRARFAAQFSTHGWLPAEAQLNAERWAVPAELLKLEGYENVIASLTARFVSNRFDVRAAGLAHPTPALAQRGFPEVQVSLGVDGDATEVRLRSLDVQSPWLSATLTNTVSVTWEGVLRAEPARLRIAADLGKLPGAALSGRVDGFVQIEPQTGAGPPVAQFGFSVHEPALGGLNPKAIQVRGAFAAPLLTFDEVRADFEDGAAVATGAFDLNTRRILQGRWRLAGSMLARLLPGVRRGDLAASGELHGPVTNLAHRGEALITGGSVTGLKPFDVRVTWDGEDQVLTSAELKWTAGESVLSVSAGAHLDVIGRKATATLRAASLRRADQALYSLQHPCAISFNAGDAGDGNRPGPARWTFGLDTFLWGGSSRVLSARADLSWPRRGEAALSMTNVAWADFSDFLDADIAGAVVTGFAATGHWSNGPVHAVISGAGSWSEGTNRTFDVRGELKAGEVLTIEHALVSSGSTPALAVTGKVPVKLIVPQIGREYVIWDKTQPIALSANWTDPRSRPLPVPLGTLGIVEISQPHLSLQISGTPQQPRAELVADLSTVAWRSKTTNAFWPELDEVHLTVMVQPDAVELQTFTATVDGQSATAAGLWPISSEDWRRLWSERKLPDWSRAHGRLDFKEAQIAAWASYFPRMVSPEGQFSAALELKTGKILAGAVRLTNAATRSIGPITPLRDVDAVVRFEGGRAFLESFRGQIGGQPVRADGVVSVAKLDGTGLDYQVHLRGSNVPLARSPEWMLRGDLDLSFRGASNRPPIISGGVTLHDGLLVQHASALVWNGPRRPEWRPPYFSVTNEPFGRWKLDLALRGDSFLRARTPVFSGTFSADFQLRGTLAAPVLTGDARVTAGRLIFPFGALVLNQGFASFTGADARGPDVQINASGRSYRYDLRLEVKGPADGANITFSSTPPLASEEILLMLTAGELPESDFTFSGSARAGRLATFLGKDLLSRYLGSDPAEERLILRSGENISKDGRLTYSVEYRLSDRWSIIGEYDEFNAFNTDLKWKLFTR